MQVQAATNGVSEEIILGEGDHVGAIEATTWDGAEATLQESLGDGWADVDDPYNVGNALTRTENGNLFRLTGGSKYRRNVAEFGESTVGLKLIINRAGK
jgi:hypothetical protein